MKKFLTVLLFILLGIGIICGGLALANKINQQAMNKYIDSFGKVEYENQLAPEYDENGVAYFTTDGDFKVLHLTDIHIGGGVFSAKKDKLAIGAVAAMVTAEKPDLVVVTGDISFAVPWSGTINNRYAHEYFKRIMENLGVYWTVTFGNHDSEAYDFYNRAAVAKMYEDENLKFCLFNADDGGVYGEGNHIINVKNSLGLITQTMVMMDTNSYTDDDPFGLKWSYDNIHQDQIDWYKSTIEGLNKHNEAIINSLPDSESYENFRTVKSLLFVHIPLMETRRAFEEYKAAGFTDTENVKHIFGIIGEKEAPYIYPSETEENMFETMLELGSTQAMFFGHDHQNSLVVEYKGIILSYGYSIDYFAYSGIGKMGAQRGCTVINCHTDGSVDIIHENFYQDKYETPYEKESVDMTEKTYY